jgi:hypothetical protein
MIRSMLVSFLVLLPLASGFLGTFTSQKKALAPPLNLFGGGAEKKKKGGMGAMVDQFKQVTEMTKRAKQMQVRI